MAGKSIAGDGLTADLAGMTKNQLYDIMSQMKALIEQNKQQARDILIQNPALTRALFQAQIMLGMVQPPQVIPNIQPAATQQLQQSGQPLQQSNTQASRSFPGQVGLQDQAGASQLQPPMRKQHQSQPLLPISTASTPPANLQTQPIPPHPLQPPQQLKGHLNAQVTPMSGPQSSQLPNIPPHSLHSASQPSPLHQPQMPSVSSQLQQPLQTSGIPHIQLQPPMAPPPRPSPMPSFHHQYGSQMGPNVGFQHAAAQHQSQPMYHSGNKQQSNMVSSFPQGQQSLPSQSLPQSLYQPGGSHLGADFSNQGGSSMQIDRGSSWMSGPPDTSTMVQLPAPPPLVPSHMGPPANQPSRSMTPDMEKLLLQQVMSLTPEQINLLPPEQRNQVLQLQQMLCQ